MPTAAVVVFDAIMAALTAVKASCILKITKVLICFLVEFHAVL